MYKNTTNLIEPHYFLNIFNNLDFDRVYYFSNFKQKIYQDSKKLTIISYKNDVISKELFYQHMKDIKHEIEEINLDSTINYFKNQTDCGVTFSSKGLIFYKKIKQHNHMQYVFAYTISSLLQIKKFVSNTDFYIQDFNLLYVQLLNISFGSKVFNILLNIKNDDAGQIFIDLSTAKRLIKIPDIDNVPFILTKSEIKTIKRLQSTKKPKISIPDIFNKKRQILTTFKFNNIFTVHIYENSIKITGFIKSKREFRNKSSIFKNNCICLNYLKYTNKFDDLKSQLEYYKIKNV